MKNKVLLICCFLFFSFCFVILFKSLNNFNAYKPETIKNEKLASFVAKDFFSGEEISSDKILTIVAPSTKIITAYEKLFD